MCHLATRNRRFRVDTPAVHMCATQPQAADHQRHARIFSDYMLCA